MLKLYCDRCGKEMLVWRSASTIFEAVEHMYPGRTQITFCDECQKAFENWLWYGEKGADDGQHP